MSIYRSMPSLKVAEKNSLVKEMDICEYLDNKGIKWFPLNIEIKWNEEEKKYEKNPKYSSIYKAMPLCSDFKNVPLEKIKYRQQFRDFHSHIAIDLTDFKHIDIDFTEDKINNKEYDEKTLKFVEMCKQHYPYYKSSTKLHGKHFFFETDYDFGKHREDNLIYEDIEFLCEGWSWCPQDAKIHNAKKTELQVKKETIAKIIKQGQKDKKKTIKRKKRKPSNETQTQELPQKPNYENTELKEIEDIAELIDIEYLDSYNTWTKIIWSLKNYENYDLIDLAKYISAKSDKYDEYSFLELWDNAKSGNTIGTLFYYAKLSNEEEYNNIRLRKLKELDTQFLSCDDTLAELFLKGNEGNFVLMGEKQQLYTFYNKRWFEDFSKGKLGNMITKDLRKIFNLQLKKLFLDLAEVKRKMAEASEAEQKILEVEEKKVKDEIALYNKLISNILTASKIDHIIKQVIRQLSVIDFSEIEFDKNPYLFCFKNKIYDLKTHNWVEVNREDYVLTYLNYDYEDCNDEELKQIEYLFKQLLPNENIRNNFIHYLATCLYQIYIEKFILMNGSGRNGKGVLTELMMALLGKYGYNGASSTLLAPLKTGANPELANMHKKRMIVYREPEAEKASLNISTIKEITGGDKLNARGLYKGNTETILSGTYIMECNDRPLINGKLDEAAVERWVDILFPSFFTMKKELYENKDLNNVYKANKYYKSQEFKDKGRFALFRFLINWIKKYEEENEKSVCDTFADCKEVKERVDKYIETCDEKYEWFITKYEKGEDKDFASVKEVYERFKVSEIWENMTKKEKRKNTYKVFCDYLQQSVNFKMFYKDRYKDHRRVLLTFKEKEDTEKNTFLETSEDEIEYEDI